MKYLKTFLIALMLISPAFSGAQSYYGGGYYSWYNDDGSTDASSTTRERIRQYRQQSSEIRQKIDALGTIANQSVFMPVLFGVGIKNISPNFGDPRPNGRTHLGEDIMAVKGTPIVSPTDAVVLRTAVGSSEGNAVYTANPGGETFVYMHLDRFGEGVTPGKVLTQGALIGYVGNTGNAAGGPAHLHFEIHNSQNVPVDPFPRLTGEFTLIQKMSYLPTILGQTSNPADLVTFLMTNFRSTFVQAQSQNLSLPPQIITALANSPITGVSSSPSAGTLPVGDLAVGSSGAAVVTLQNYLIGANSGPAAAALAAAGATGNFGPITKSALIEFQIKIGIAPANGYYGLSTRTYASGHPIASGVIPASPTPSQTAPNSNTKLTRDLHQGSSGEDVRTLQKILNGAGYMVAASGAGSLGNESVYFGPATLSAVIRFQIAKNISPPAGYVGPLTRAALGLMQ